MTERQKNILKTALDLFSEEGYASTSTKKIAKEAGVSEGLIFRHFKSKEGLLNEIIEQGRKESEVIFKKLAVIIDPSDVIQQVLSLPFDLEPERHSFWRLLYSIKWQTDVYDKTVFTPFKDIITKAFKKLGYYQPEIEAEVLLSIVDGINSMILLKEPKNKEQIKQTLLKRYR